MASTSPLARRQFIRSAVAGAVAAPALMANAQTQTAPAASGATATPLRVGSDNDAAPSAAFKAQDIVRPLQIADLNDLENEARKVMDPGAFAFISSGSDSQWTLRENRAAFGRIAIKPQYLVGKPAPDLRITLLGQQLSLPVITTPMGAHGLAHQSAELGTARGTGEAGTLMTVSTAANRTIEDIAAATKGPKWFQLYLADDLSKSRDLLKRAEAAGYSAVVLAIDAFAPGSSDATLRMGFQFPANLGLVNSGSSTFKKSLSWDDVKFVKDNTRLPLVLKGVLTPEMAQLALEHGVAAIQVSNHGGRQLDGVSAAIDALPGIVDVVQKRVPIIMDSGIRRGTDVFKALALGANAVAIGRPVLYALSLGGWMGVKSAYDRLKAELTRDMLIAGLGSVQEFNRDFVMRAPGQGAS
ncbi:alpha-hydroxy acid oxidase [Diaphorobacter caeni]|uniref:alpha-hydroxy acid oxidase n=1 Tax=Diaphorobacter caeni TaxID=2784387 RepID=UPI00188E69D9|nr:alpha-hydroxy acid oxidase [Diaphorobacter caeni]MBF5004575.1 alpha-hydroxy-acid oxidizing protein [Diaphorobacter caeni]